MKSENNGMRTQTNKVHQELRQRIIEGVYLPSESLKEHSLASEFDVSRNTIRKALLKLESENLVIIEENKSAQVRRFSLEEALHYLEIRALLEGLAIRQSFPLLGAAEITGMRTALASMRESLDTLELLQYSHHDWQFHDVVYQVCPNRPAVEMIRSIKNLMRQCKIRTIFVPGRGEESFCEHEAILSALEKGDANEAEHTMIRHMRSLKAVLANNVELVL